MQPTTREAIRDRIREVIEQLVPAHLESYPFRRYELADIERDFRSWCRANPQACFRTVFVRDTGVYTFPTLSDAKVVETDAEFEVVIAYVANQLTGPDGELDLDDLMAEDRLQVDNAIGMCGTSNFTTPHPEACWLLSGANITREDAGGVVFLVFRHSMFFNERVSA